MRERIIAEIQRLAAADGQPPGRMKFEKETGIRYSDWYGVYWARWGDAVAEAGLSPNSVQAKADRDTLLEKIAEAYRSVGHVATEGELRLYGRRHADFPGHSTIFNHFGGKAGLLAALREWVARTPEFADVAAMLPEEERPAPAPRGTKPKDGSRVPSPLRPRRGSWSCR